MANPVKMILCALPVILLAGCAPPDHPLPIGESPAAQPPRLIRDENGQVGWDNPKAFGRLPGSQVRAGLAACRTMNTFSVKYVPIGYHAQAMDLNGNPIPGGGFFCVPK